MKKTHKILSLFICLLMLASCGSNSSGGAYDNNNGAGVADTETSSNHIVDSDGTRKIIYTVSYSICNKDMDKTINQVNAQIYTLEGYIVNSNQHDTYACYTYKVPTQKLNGFLDYLDGIEGKGNKTIKTQDVTSNFNSIEAKLETLNARKDSYEKMLQDNADSLTIQEKMSIYDKIDDLNTQIKTVEKEYTSLQGSVDYSTVNIDYSQSDKKTTTFFATYGAFLVSLGKTIGETILYILPFAAVGGIVCLIIFIVRKNKKNKNLIEKK